MLWRGRPRDGLFCRAFRYKEYERAALADGRAAVEDPSTKAFSILAIINPCNPTGKYLRVDERRHVA